MLPAAEERAAGEVTAGPGSLMLVRLRGELRETASAKPNQTSQKIERSISPIAVETDVADSPRHSSEEAERGAQRPLPRPGQSSFDRGFDEELNSTLPRLSLSASSPNGPLPPNGSISARTNADKPLLACRYVVRKSGRRESARKPTLQLTLKLDRA